MKTNTDNKDYTRRNRFNGDTIEITKEESKKHDDRSNQSLQNRII